MHSTKANSIVNLTKHGRVLEEKSVSRQNQNMRGATVTLNYGDEYGIRIRNTESTKLHVNIFIDGVDTGWTIVKPTSDVTLNTFIDTNNSYKFSKSKSSGGVSADSVTVKCFREDVNELCNPYRWYPPSPWNEPVFPNVYPWTSPNYPITWTTSTTGDESTTWDSVNTITSDVEITNEFLNYTYSVGETVNGSHNDTPIEEHDWNGLPEEPTFTFIFNIKGEDNSLPCPFCKSNTKMKDTSIGDQKRFKIICNNINCVCHDGVSDYFKNPKDAVIEWNKSIK